MKWTADKLISIEVGEGSQEIITLKKKSKKLVRIAKTAKG